MERLTEIRQRIEAATDGPWERFDTPYYAEIHVLGGKEAGFLPVALADKAYNTDFIAHSREDIPYLLAEVDRLTALHKREIIVTGEYAQRVIDLTARAEAAEAERDAAVEDLKIFSACCQCNANIDGSCCDMFDGTAENKYFCSNWQWRGPQEAGEGEHV